MPASRCGLEQDVLRKVTEYKINYGGIEMYKLHPSEKLSSIFENKPYQGANPAEAKFLFFDLGANYEESLAEKWYFSEVVEYLSDGVSYWQLKGVHHPFMLPDYKGDGKLYHRRFAQIGFKPVNASEVSFVELVNFPTICRSKLNIDDLSEDHLKVLSSWVLEGKAEYIFIPAGVLRRMKESKVFGWIVEYSTLRLVRN
jgi:hypothetical protein